MGRQRITHIRIMATEAFLLNELLGDDIVGAKEDGAALGEDRPADEERRHWLSG